ncbi:MAG: RidA family protein [Thermostichus sp. BF3_bins_97]
MTIERYDVLQGPGRPHISLGLAHENWVTACSTAKDCSGDVKSQAQQILNWIETVLHRAGTDKSKLLTAMIWLRNMQDYGAFNAVWNAWVDPANPPVRACVRADLARPDVLIEIKITAAR